MSVKNKMSSVAQGIEHDGNYHSEIAILQSGRAARSDYFQDQLLC